jgi:acetate kinase
MGLTPLEGLPGGTRSGTLDPSLIFHLFPSSSEAGKIKETNGMKIGQGELLLNKESGFKGLCGSNEYGQIEKMAKEQRENGDSEGKELLTVQIFENRIMVSSSFSLLSLFPSLSALHGSLHAVIASPTQINASCPLLSPLYFLGGNQTLYKLTESRFCSSFSV